MHYRLDPVRVQFVLRMYTFTYGWIL